MATISFFRTPEFKTDKEIDGLYGEKIKIESPHSNEYYKVVVVK